MSFRGGFFSDSFYALYLVGTAWFWKETDLVWLPWNEKLYKDKHPENNEYLHKKTAGYIG